MRKTYIFPLCLLLFACTQKHNSENEKIKQTEIKQDTFKIFTPGSELKNIYDGFNSPNAINRLAEIENEYFNAIGESYSKYYGTMWRRYHADEIKLADSTSLFKKYASIIEDRNEITDSMHCTIYAVEALKAGLGDSSFAKLEKSHQRIWKKREHAGWSIGYILVKEFGWKAYLVISKNSPEYSNCVSNYKKDKKYHVWKQPNIPLEGFYDFDKDKMEIERLLSENEFAWGFSDQGWHTWITRFDTLKECNWLGTPSLTQKDFGEEILFLSTKFSDYRMYSSHILVFPPRKN